MESVWWKRGSFHGVPWTASGEVWQPPWSPMERWKRGSFHGVPWIAQFWMRGWWSDTSGMHRLTVSRQLVLERPGLSIK